MSTALQRQHLAGIVVEIAAERQRQIEVKGFDAARDDAYVRAELELAALTYIHHAETFHARPVAYYRALPPGALWPWPAEGWRPSSPRGDLITAGALLQAERDRLRRAGRTERDGDLQAAIDRVIGRVERLDAGGPPLAWTTPHECFLMLLLAGPIDLTEAEIATWPQDQREAAADWAAAVYAAGCDPAKAPPRPEFVRLKPPTEDVICTGCGRVGAPPPPPALSCCPERNPVPLDSDAGRVAALSFEGKLRPAPEYFLRRDDPLSPVYEVDFAAGVWRLAASSIGVPDGAGGVLKDDGERFRSAAFERVYPSAEVDSVVTYTRAVVVLDQWE